MQDNTIHEAKFEANLGLYWLLSGAAYFSLSIIGIPLLLLWFPLGLWGTRRYINNMSARLTSKKLIVRRGILTRTENTVPLDKITDIALIQGPIMRLMGLHKLTVETAGQSGTGSLISLVGIVDAPGFRAQILEQKERLSGLPPQPEVFPVTNDNPLLAQLVEMTASLKRIEGLLASKYNS